MNHVITARVRYRDGLPAIGASFTMIGHDGRVVRSADLAGRPYLVFFGYTHCPDFCPTALLEISAAFEELGQDKNITALFVTVDPERDTPDVLKSYLENFDPRIVGLTGDLHTASRGIRAVVQSLMPRNSVSDAIPAS